MTTKKTSNSTSNLVLGAVAVASLSGGAYMWWRGRQMKRPPLMGSKAPTGSSSVVWGPAGPILVKPLATPDTSKISIIISEDDKNKFEAKLATNKIVSKRPVMARIDELVTLNNKHSDGLLGKLVAQYWANQRARSWYQTRTGAYAWDDDTPLYLSKNNPWIGVSDYKSRLKKATWYGVGHNEDYWKKRYYNDDSGSLSKFRGRSSLESTFSNWSAPCFIRSPESGYGGWGNRFDMGTDYINWSPSSRWSTKYDKQSKFWDTSTHHVNPAKLFRDGRVTFSEYVAEMERQRVFWGYENRVEEFYGHHYDNDNYGDTQPLKSFGLKTIPWRNYNLVSASDRRQVGYKWKNAYGNPVASATHWEEYYNTGYCLVRTALDVVLARGNWDIAKTYPAFAEHCNWWFIPVPTRELIMKAPDISAIGGGITGLADVDTETLLKYVMAITPVPGSIPPWEDKGPLWTWPAQAGSMSIQRVGDGSLGNKQRDSDGVWGTIAQFVLGVEVSICANVASGIVSEAVDVVLEQAVAKATELAADWLGSGVDQVLSAVESKLGGAALDAAKEAITNCSAFAANIRRFTDGTSLLSDFKPAGDLARQLTDYLDGVVENVPAITLNQLKQGAESTIDGIRKSWDWADDLVGSASSWGSKASKAAGIIDSYR